MGLEQRERTELSEQLHDGALQYVLAARMDLDELADSAEPVALARAGKALGEATTLLRSSVSELHPTVLVHVGLARAIGGDLARSAQGRGGVVVDVDTSAGTTIYARLPTRSCSAPPESFWATSSNMPARRTSGSSLHDWTTVRCSWSRTTVGGISADRIAERRAAGHIGLLSHELRVVAAGGSFSVGPGEESGTLARVEIPFQIVTATDTIVEELSMAALITDRELNLATLARQFLLRRAEVSALDAIEHLAGLQAQAPNPPYLALWARLKNFAAEDLSTLVEKRQVVRLVAMRGGTVFALSAADAGPFRATVQTIMERDLHTNSTQRAALTGLDLDALARAGRDLVADGPLTQMQMRPILAERFPGHAAEGGLAHGVRGLLPMVQVPPRGLWGDDPEHRH